MTTHQKNQDSFDLAKYILSIMVVAIHSSLFPMILYPWLRLAVPLFFMISSYLLFLKINSSGETEQLEHLKKYIVRNLKLYLFWFIALFPLTIFYHRQWFTNGFLDAVRNIITQTLFSSTFMLSWFITASVTASVILFATRKINKAAIAVLAVFIYFICCIRSSYFSCVNSNIWVQKIVYYYEYLFTNPVFSFPVAVFWMFIGKCFADAREKSIQKPTLIFTTLFFSAALWVEWRFVYNLNGTFNNDCYLFLAPLSICIFFWLKDSNLKISNPRLLRQISTVTFALHGSVIPIISFFFKHFFHKKYYLAIFLLSVFICHVAAFIILKLEKNSHFSFLKYSH